MPYDGTLEMKKRGDGSDLYIRKWVNGKQTSVYVGTYSEYLDQQLQKNAKEAKIIKKELRKIEKQLSAAGYTDDKLPAAITDNMTFVRVNLKTILYDQAVLEGIDITFSQMEDILDNRIMTGVKASDALKILNLNRA